MKYPLGEMVAFGYKVGTITQYNPENQTYQVEWMGRDRRLEMFTCDKIGALRENFNTLRNLIKLSGQSNGI